VATTWLQLTLAGQGQDAERLEDALLQAGALAVTLTDGGDQPVLEPEPGTTPLWSYLQVTGLFAGDTDMTQVQAALSQTLGQLPEWRLARLAERDWVRAWMDDFQPMRFGERLWVCPRHQTPPLPDAVIVSLDPGLAFGTGTHPTTALCLRWLDCALLTGKNVLDYGCGSGILAIAAAKLGALRVWAVDTDPQALHASAQNAAANAVAERIELHLPVALPAVTVDILLANILAGPLCELAARLAGHVKTGGWLVLSGILAAQVDAVKTAYVPWFEFQTTWQQDEWSLLAAVRKAA